MNKERREELKNMYNVVFSLLLENMSMNEIKKELKLNSDDISELAFIAEINCNAAASALKIKHSIDSMKRPTSTGKDVFGFDYRIDLLNKIVLLDSYSMSSRIIEKIYGVVDKMTDNLRAHVWDNEDSLVQLYDFIKTKELSRSENPLIISYITGGFSGFLDKNILKTISIMLKN